MWYYVHFNIMWIQTSVQYVYRCFDVTLKDFRNAIGKSSSHKFFFKSQVPDIGQVKEEVRTADTIHNRDRH